MLSLLVDFLGFVAAALLLVALVLLLRGPFRKYPLLFLYVTWEFLANLGLTILDRLYNGSGAQTPNVHTSLEGPAQVFYRHIYWTNDVSVDLLRFIVVIVFTYQAMGPSPARAPFGRLLGGIAIGVILLPFLLFHPHFTPWPQAAWFASTSQMLNFGAAIMNLVLWGVLIANKQRDPQILTVSAGLGVVVTGAAISYGLYHFIPPGTLRAAIPNVFLMLTQIAGWTIWCRAFWPAKKKAPLPSGSLASP